MRAHAERGARLKQSEKIALCCDAREAEGVAGHGDLHRAGVLARGNHDDRHAWLRREGLAGRSARDNSGESRHGGGRFGWRRFAFGHRRHRNCRRRRKRLGVLILVGCGCGVEVVALALALIQPAIGRCASGDECCEAVVGFSVKARAITITETIVPITKRYGAIAKFDLLDRAVIARVLDRNEYRRDPGSRPCDNGIVCAACREGCAGDLRIGVADRAQTDCFRAARRHVVAYPIERGAGAIVETIRIEPRRERDILS